MIPDYVYGDYEFQFYLFKDFKLYNRNGYKLNNMIDTTIQNNVFIKNNQFNISNFINTKSQTLYPDTEYKYRVAIQQPDGSIHYTTGWKCFKTIKFKHPLKPVSNIQIIGGGKSINPRIKWVNPNKEDDLIYEIYISKADTQFTLVGSTSDKVYNFTNLSQNTNYYGIIKCKKPNSDNKAVSNVFTFTTGSDTSELTENIRILFPANNIQLNKRAYKNLNIRWQFTRSKFNRFEIYAGSNKNNLRVVGSTQGTQNNFNYKVLPNASILYIQIVCKDSTGTLIQKSSVNTVKFK